MSGRLELIRTPLSGLTIIQRKPLRDSRGFLERLYCSEELQSIMSGKPIAQINRSITMSRGAVRGMHFQFPPHSEIKVVSCLKGEVFDVAVDLRRGSPTFLRWHSETLTADNHKTFVIPDGFAHGFQALSDSCEMLYLHTAPYSSNADGGFNALDPALRIDWPLPITERSPRDEALPLIDERFEGLAI